MTQLDPYRDVITSDNDPVEEETVAEEVASEPKESEEEPADKETKDIQPAEVKEADDSGLGLSAASFSTEAPPAVENTVPAPLTEPAVKTAEA